MPAVSSASWGPWRSILVLLPLLVVAPWHAINLHYALPKPVVDEFNAETSLPQLSEARILAHAKHLSEGIGYRIVGTREHALGDEWMLDQANAIQKLCQEAVRTRSTRHLECEVFRQQGSGSHRFDIMGKRLYKTYRDLTNIIVRISNGTDAGKQHAVLVNAHLDSTLPSPGAADDAMPVGVMLECMRVLVGSPDWEPAHAIIFLFNNAEESLQDGSHLYSTQHPTAHTVRAFINLEAAGTTGPELLFQATSQEMIEAYANVPWPHGTIVANDVFSSGIIMSDTDFRQFELYLNITGLDMAVVGNSYMYHMRKDLVEYIQPGVAQHMADNALSLLLQLSAPSSPLPRLDYGYSRPTTNFFSLLGQFITYSFQTALALHVALLTSAVALVLYTANGSASILRESVLGTASFGLAFVGALVGVNVVALIMKHVFGRAMSWFASELSCLVLYGPAALAGALASHLLVGRIAHIPERALLDSLLISHALLATLIQYIGIGSGGMYFLSGLPLFVALLINHLHVGRREKVSLLTYAIGQAMPLLIGTEFTISALDVFVPLTGRMGVEAPSEHIIASLVAISGSYALPLAIPFAHRFGHRTLVRSVLFLSALSGIVMVAFAFRSPYDDMHQKRMYVLHAENITSGERHLQVSGADGAPGFELIAQAAAKQFGIVDLAATAVDMTEWVPTWDSIYPFAAFLSPYQIELPPLNEYTSPWASTFKVSAANDTVDEAAGTRRLSLVVDHPGLIWTTIGFDAHVLWWSLDDNPPTEYARHHVKEASFYGVDSWSIDLLIAWPPPTTQSRFESQSADAIEGLKVDYVGIIEKGMYPAKKAEKALGGPGMALLEKMDVWLEETYKGTVDALLMSTVGGVSVV